MSNGELCFGNKYLLTLKVTFLYFNVFFVDNAFLQEKKRENDVVERPQLC